MVDLRASDAERDAAAGALRLHHEAGRLTAEEYEGRLAAALASRTQGELAALQADLPPPPMPAVVAQEVKVGWPGLRRFRQRHLIEDDVRSTWHSVLQHIVPSMVGSGAYTVVSQSAPDILVFEAQERPWWVPLVCIFAFPLGLFALLVRSPVRIVLTLSPAGDNRTELAIAGQARRDVRKAFAGLSASPPDA